MPTPDRTRLALGLAELPRAAFETLSLAAAAPWLGLSPAGDGHDVLVLPGFGASDDSTRPLRAFLQSRGFNAHPWRLGRNLGLRRIGGTQALQERFLQVAEVGGGRPVSLVGWSLGGVYARGIAKWMPESVRHVATLGSPIAGPPSRTAAWRAYQSVNGEEQERVVEQFVDALRQPPAGVPCTSIYSRSDAVVPWTIAMEPDGPMTDNIEVISSHIGLGVNPAVFYALADRLALPLGDWRPFCRSGWRRAVYGPASRDESEAVAAGAA